MSEAGDPMSGLAQIAANANNFDNINRSPLARPTISDIASGISLFFKYCHRQPIWCFERSDVSDYSSVPEELACSILALTARFSDRREQWTVYGRNVKKSIMMRIANGTVDLTTIESLCLLSYSSFIGEL